MPEHGRDRWRGTKHSGSALSERLGARVKRAEDLIASGDWNAGFEAYGEIVTEELLHAQQPWSSSHLLVVERFGDLASMVGLRSVALDAYPKVVADGAPAVRIPVLAKMLQLASSTRAPSARIYRQLESALWNGELQQPRRAESFEPGGLGYRTEAMVCLGLGCFWNSVRYLPESGGWLERGVQSFGPNAEDRLGVIPLRLTLANHYLTIGDLERAQAELRMAETEIGSAPGGETYRMWLEDAAIRVAFTRGNLAEVLRRLDSIEAVARAKLLWGTMCRILLVRAETLVLLNQLEGADACLEEALSLPQTVWTAELKTERERISRFRRLRAGLSLNPGPSAGEMQGDARDIIAFQLS